MVLELTKAFSFFATMLALYPVVISAFFVPATRWQERLFLALAKLAIAGCIALASGLIFSWPSPTNPDAGQALTSTLPVRLFLYASIGLAILFAASWYLVCGGPVYSPYCTT
jgi:hypothetical protein